MSTTLSEIEELKLQLKTVQKQLADVQKIARIGSWEWNMQTNEVWWSDELYQVFYLHREDLTPTFEAFLAVVHPDDLAVVQAEIHQSIEQQKPYSLQHRKISPDGSIKYLLAKADFIFDDQGKMIKMLGIAQDITEQVETQKALEDKQANLLAMIENTDDLIWALTVDAKVMAFNTNFFNIFQHVYGHNLQVGEAYMPLLSSKPDRKEIWEELHHKAIAGEKLHFELAFDFYDETHYYEIFCNPIRDTSGQIYGVSYKSSDISTRKANEQLLVEFHKKELEEERHRQNIKSLAVIEGQEDERRRLSMELHDGVGQLLTALYFQNSFLKSKLPADDQLQEVVSSIGELLESGKLEIRRITNNLMPKVLDQYGLNEALIQLMQSMFSKLEIDTTISLLEQDKRYNKSIEVALYRIVQELFNNCIKYAKASHVELTLEENNQFLLLVYLDDGIGFSEEAVAQQSGHGLNNIVHRANLLKGNASIKSQLGKGCLVTIKIPLTYE